MRVCGACGVENPEGSSFCNACGERLADAAPAAEVRKVVTVVFCDVTGSTGLGERLDPEALRRVMMRYFAAMTEAVERHGGTVEKYIGDAVMAVFGIPTMHEDDALRACRAADDMRTALTELNEELERDHGTTLRCRIGVNTGEVVAGDATSRQALVTGDTVNVAARLEQTAAPGEVLISGSVLPLVRDAVDAEPVEPLGLKGKAEPVAAFRLLSVTPGAAGFARHLDSPLVGRARQVAQLRQAFDEVVADRVCHLFTVLGPPGVGKSRLVEEALAGLGPEVTVLRGRCLSYGEGITYWPVAEIVGQALVDGPGVGDSRTRIASLLSGDDASQVAGLLAGLLGEDQGAATTAEDVGWAVRRFLEDLARTAPLVVALDDLHWAEKGLLDLIDALTDWSRDAPILVICMARPELLETRPGWGGGKLHATTLALEPLAPDEVLQLTEGFLGGEVDPALGDRILEASAGNPLFVEETLAMLLDDEVLHEQDGRWTATDLDAVSVPPTIHALLAARLDRLDDQERTTLGHASVVGQVFYLSALRDLTPETGGETVDERLRHLVRRDLVRPAPSDLAGETAFRFHHPLLRDAAYEMLPKEARSRLHERFASWLEARPQMADLDEFAGYHLEQAYALASELGPADERSGVLAERAAARLSSAATRARDRGDGSAAAALYERANAMRRVDDPARVRDLLSAAWALTDVERATESLAVFEEALTAARMLSDRGPVLHAELGTMWARTIVDPEGGTELLAARLEEALPELEALGVDEELAIGLLIRAQVEWMGCRFGAARGFADRALDHAKGCGNRMWIRWSSDVRTVGGLMGAVPVEDVLADVDDYERIVSPSSLTRANAASVRGSAYAMLGRDEEAAASIAQAIALATEARGAPGGAGLQNRFHAEMLANRPEDAEQTITAMYEWLVRGGDTAYASTAAGNRASALLRMGLEDEAHRWADECRRTSASDDVVNQQLWRRVEAVLAAREDRGEDAVRLIGEAQEWVGRTDMLMEQAEVHLCEAEVHARAGRRAEALAALDGALAAYRTKGATVGETIVERHRRELGLDAVG